jgi:ubiquinone biosynthesis protein
MPDASPIEQLWPESPDQLKAAFYAAGETVALRIGAVEAALRSPAGPMLRQAAGKWIVERLPIEELVPEKYASWRVLVQDAMQFTVWTLSAGRLAPKLVEQWRLPADTPTEERLLLLIAKVPGLQKLGQVLARNRHLLPPLRCALSELENSIRDVNPAEVRKIILQELGPRLRENQVKLRPGIFSEASVSAVTRFTWWNPELGRRERGVFKVLKPYIPVCFAEDMELLSRLAKYLGARHREYGFGRRVLNDTFCDVRELLQHEVNFAREQATLQEAREMYRGVRGVRVPRVISPLCTSRITALTEEPGKKITNAARRLPMWRRLRLSEQLLEAFIAVPIFAAERRALFHADPHAGNLLYDERSGELVILDWALTERVTREQRRRLGLLFVMSALRDPAGMRQQIEALSRKRRKIGARQAKIIRECVERFIARLPLTRLPQAVDTTDLLEDIAFKGVRLPAPLIMLRKVLFTLDGVQHDLGAGDVGMASIMARQGLQNWLTSWSNVGSPLYWRDWLGVEWSTLFLGGRLCRQAMNAGRSAIA